MKEVTVKLMSSSKAAAAALQIPTQVVPREVSFDLVVAFVQSPGHFYIQLGKYVLVSVLASCKILNKAKSGNYFAELNH